MFFLVFRKATLFAFALLTGCTNFSSGSLDSNKNKRIESESPYENLMEEFPPVVSIITSQPVKYEYKEMRGSYSQHTEMINYLLTVAKEANSPAIFAVYPDDPDLVAESELKWQIGFELPTHKQINSGLLTRNIEKSLIAKLPSNVLETPRDGKKLLAWIDLNGYVQTKPTMVRFPLNELESNLKNPVIEIIIPIAKRSHF